MPRREALAYVSRGATQASASSRGNPCHGFRSRLRLVAVSVSESRRTAGQLRMPESPGGATEARKPAPLPSRWIRACNRVRDSSTNRDDFEFLDGIPNPFFNCSNHNQPKIFISYRRDDDFAAGMVGRLYEHLSGRFRDDNVFMDVDSIPPGVDFIRYLDQAVAQTDALLAVMGR